MSSIERFFKEVEPSEDGTRRYEYRCPQCTYLLGIYGKLSDQPWGFEIKCTRRSCKAPRYHGNVVPMTLYEFRCQGIDKKRSERFGEEVVCNKLLARALPETDIEIKCPRCGSIQNAKDRQKDEDTGQLG